MAVIDIFVFIAGGVGGGALVWHYKDRFVSWYKGATAFAADLEAKAAAIKAAVK